MKNLSFLLIFSLLGILGCNKSDDTPPAPPITAENTFSCKINGELFVPENHGGFITQKGYLVETFGENSWLFTLSDREIDIYIFIKKVNHNGEYIVGNSDGDQDFLYDENTAVELKDKVNDITYISENTSNFIDVLDYSGSNSIMFKFNNLTLSSSENANQKIILTDGKLNINKETLNKD